MMNCSHKKVWIDPTNEKVKQAITRRDVRRFMKEGVIRKIQEKHAISEGQSRQQRTGSIRGTRKTRMGKKSVWFKVVRPQRMMLKELKDKNQIKVHGYRKLYKMVKGGAFRSRAHLNTYMKENDLLEEGKK
jgi:large subunit ribosomal protein L19e